MDRIAAYRVFVRVAERGGFSAAARDLGLSQPTVSRRIAELETYLGAALLRRTTRRLALTGEGREFLVKARAVLAALDEAEQAVGSRAQTLAGTVRLMAPAGLGPAAIAPAVCAFLARHPDLTVSWREGNWAAGGARQGIDLAVAEGMVRAGSETLRKLGDVPHVLCGAPLLIREEGSPRTVEDIARLPALVRARSDGTGVRWELERGAEIREVAPRVRLESDSHEALLAGLLEGAGIALVPLWLVRDAIAQGRLWRMLPQWRGEASPLYLATPDHPPPAARTRTLADHLASALEASRLFA